MLRKLYALTLEDRDTFAASRKVSLDFQSCLAISCSTLELMVCYRIREEVQKFWMEQRAQCTRGTGVWSYFWAKELRRRNVLQTGSQSKHATNTITAGACHNSQT